MGQKDHPLVLVVHGPVQVLCGSYWNNARGINIIVGHIIMALDMIEIDRTRDPGLVVQVAQVSVEMGVINYAPQVAFEMSVVHGIESDQGAKKTPVALDNPV